MKQILNIRIFITCILLYGVALSSCAEATSRVPTIVPTSSQTSSSTTPDFPLATATNTATPSLGTKTIIITPADIFSLPGMQAWSTPDIDDFCEHLPSPQIVTNPDRFSLLSGRFALCISERVNIAMDLDAGRLVAGDDERADIVLLSSTGSRPGEPSYGVFSSNNSYLSDAYVLEKYANHSGANNLSYEYCENLLQDSNNLGAMGVDEGAIACVKTTEGKMALIRVERIYPPNTLSVEFSFAILRDK